MGTCSLHALLQAVSTNRLSSAAVAAETRFIYIWITLCLIVMIRLVTATGVVTATVDI